jgi:4-diphosphocytidyl-2-C-methyl-D-erythritol kinase
MVAFPPCKINLGLSIVRKRGDGYHDIETCFYPLPFTDVLEIIPARSAQFTTSGLAIPGSPDENICVKACSLLTEDFALPPVSIHLHKIIPTGAGLGGGSSDAAHTLRLLNGIFNLRLDQEKLMSYAARLGSDCSFFVQDNPMMGFGRGEVLKSAEADLKGKFLILLHPGLHVSTADAYSGVTPGAPVFPIESTVTKSVDQWKILLQNDFEKSVFERFPLIATLKDELYKSGALYASMSGSGSSVFGIFETAVDVNGTPAAPYVIWKGFLP